MASADVMPPTPVESFPSDNNNNNSIKKRKRSETPSTPLSVKAQILAFRASSVLSWLRKNCAGCSVMVSAGVYATAVIEFLCGEMIRMSSAKVKSSKPKARIMPRHIHRAFDVREDVEMWRACNEFVFAGTGAQPVKLPTKKDLHIEATKLKKLQEKEAAQRKRAAKKAKSEKNKRSKTS